MKKLELHGDAFININKMYDPCDEGHTKGVMDYFREELKRFIENASSPVEFFSIQLEIFMLEYLSKNNEHQRCKLIPYEQEYSYELCLNSINIKLPVLLKEKGIKQKFLEHRIVAGKLYAIVKSGPLAKAVYGFSSALEPILIQDFLETVQAVEAALTLAEQKLYVVKDFDIKEIKVCTSLEALKTCMLDEAIACVVEITNNALYKEVFECDEEDSFGESSISRWKKNLDEGITLKACNALAEDVDAEIEILYFKDYTTVKSVVSFGDDMELKLVEYKTKEEMNAYLQGLYDMDGYLSYLACSVQ